MPPEISRRSLLGGAAAGAVALFAASPGAAAVAVPLGQDVPGYLTAAELATLRGVVDRVVPGRPEDTVAGAVDAGCHEAIDALLAAFTTSPPRIYAGGPFSDRGGSPVNHFAEFLPLDAYEEAAWRLRIEGSAAGPNGAVAGYQRTYRDGLRALAAAVPGFATLPGPVRDVALRTSDDPAVRAMLDLAVTHTLEFLHGAPEYGGNRGLVGWTTTGFDGDVQPRGYTDEEVSDPETSGPLDLVTDLLGTSAGTALALASTESVHGLLARTEGRFAALQAELAVLDGGSGADLARMHDLARALVEDVRARQEGADR